MYTERTTAAAAAARDGTARDMTARSDAACREMDGSLPGGCGNMVFPYIAMQRENAQRYDNREALLQGTLFPGLDLPFRKELRSRFPQVNEALLDDPAQVNEAPYEAWLIKVSQVSDTEELLDAEGYEAVVAAEEA